MASGEYGIMIKSKDYKDVDLMTYVRAEGLLWAGHVVRIVEKGILKLILEVNLGSRRPVGKSRYGWENVLRKDVAELLRTDNWLAAAKYSDDWREKTADDVARKRAGELLEEEGHGMMEENRTNISGLLVPRPKSESETPYNLVGNVRPSTVSLRFVEFRWS
jgi:hypothetical protein